MLQNALSRFGRTENTVVILQSHLKFDHLVQTLKVTALHQFPIIALDFPESDDYYDDSRPWHITVFENFTNRWVQWYESFSTRLTCANLINTPVGNIRNDICMDSLDLLFARQLVSSHFVMWYSESSEPDIGGSYSNQLISMPGDPFSSISHNRRGTFLSRCVDYRIAHLATSAVIECQTLIDQFLPQHAMPEASHFSSKPSLDAITLTAPVFAVLSRFLSSIVARCENDSNILSSMIGHIGTWISSQSSAFHDPAVHAVFHHFLSVLFTQMIAHFETHELPVVYADQSRLILNVGSYSPDLAFAELKSRPLLRWIDFSVVADLNKLVWMDEFNFQGICSDDRYMSSWNIARFLPGKHSNALVDFFSDLLLYDDEDLSGYFRQISKNFFKLADEARYAPSVTENPLRSPADQTHSDFLLLVGTFFRAVENLGDTKLQHEILALRANILKIMGVGEFDPRAKFVDPSLSLVVPSVLCHHCFGVRNIDILRDEDMLKKSWLCVYCLQPYDVRIFESWIFEDFSRRCEAYTMQDLRCARCGKVQSRKMAGTCEDGGAFQLSISRESMLERMNVIQVAAKMHDFTDLAEAIDTFIALA
jgi:DNA polymerase epsilon subunit 1